jgi:phage host-nuclease inhibitor protein Gam
MAKRTKTKALPELTKQEAEKLLGEFAITDAMLCKLTAEMDEEIHDIREKYAELAGKHQERHAELQDMLQAFAEKNKEAYFTKKRSLAMQHGNIGFRKGTPKAKTKKGFTWAAVLELCRTIAPDFIRTKEEVAKEMMIAQREDEKKMAIIDKVGVLIANDETFFIELKKEEVPA